MAGLSRFKPGIYSDVFAASGKRGDNFAAALVVAVWAEDVGGFGVSKKTASDTDAEESEKVQIVELFRSPPRKTLPFVQSVGVFEVT